MESFNISRSFLLSLFLLMVVAYTATARPGTDPSDTEVTTTAKPTTAIVRKLEQLKEMEESTLIGWYEMVKKFLHLVKSDNETLPLIIDYLQGKGQFVVPESIVQIAEMNTTFFVLVGIGLTYIVVMLLSGIFFMCCRYCGRCGAKDSQRQRSTVGCWRTTHKFCLVVMIAFLVVPFICMCIINEHMKQSLPNAKSNATEVFTILIDYANRTQEEIDQFAKNAGRMKTDEQLHQFFQEKFASPVKENISELINEKRLDDIKSIVNWLIAVKENYTDLTNTTSLSSTIQAVKAEIMELRDLSNDYCVGKDDNEICKLELTLPVENIDIEHNMESIAVEFEKLVKYSDLQDVIDKIQNNTMLSDVFSEMSEDFKKLVEDFKPHQKEEVEKIVKKINTEIEKISLFFKEQRGVVEHALAKTDGYEIYRWWAMFGLALILIIPVGFLILGLVCGCCGYEKGRHPTKRSSASNCGGYCLILAVYCFFLIASVLMLLTIGLFVIGGNLEIFVCAPLYEDDLKVLDQVKEKLDILKNDDFNDLMPSKILRECKEDRPIFEVLDLQARLNANGNSAITDQVESKLKESGITQELKSNISMKTNEIKEYFDDFTKALNLTEMKGFPEQLQNVSKISKEHVSNFSDIVKLHLKEGENLKFLDDEVSQLLEDINAWDRKLNNLSVALLHISEEADFYKGKIKQLREDLDEVEKKLPSLVEKSLLEFTVAYVEDVLEKLKTIGPCNDIWISFETARTVLCQFAVNPINGYWFAMGWSLLFIIPAIIFAVKLSRHYIKMKYDDDIYAHDSGEAIPLEELNRSKPFSYTNPGGGGGGGWMPHNYVVHPASSNQARQFNYK